MVRFFGVHFSLIIGLVFSIWFISAHCQSFQLPYVATDISYIPSYVASVSAGRIAAKAINEHKFPEISLNSSILLDMRINDGSVAKTLVDVMSIAEANHTISYGYSTSGIAVAAGNMGTVFKIAQMTDSSSTTQLSDPRVYPYFSRTTLDSLGYAEALKASILHYSSIQGGWKDIAMIGNPFPFSIETAVTIIECFGDDLNVLTFQQFVFGSTTFDIELEEMKDSGARIIIAVVHSFEYTVILEQADIYGLVGDNYVWYVPNTVVSDPFASTELSRGALGYALSVHSSGTSQLDKFEELWNAADPEEYPGAGGPFNEFQLLSYDGMITMAYAIAAVEKMGMIGEYVSPEIWCDAIKQVHFEGTTGIFSFDENGDRIADVEIYFYSPEDGWTVTAHYSPNEGYIVTRDVVWKSNTTEIPDLDIREPFHYWSCHDKDDFVDETGKTVHLHTPDGSDIDDIDYKYYCDSFVDCKNFSDETSSNCSSNYLIAYIVLGAITGILILIAIFNIFLVVLFGLILGYRRLNRMSPSFLLLILLSTIVGLSSVYAWFGKPHPVACAFQPWLLGLSTLSMIAALSVKNFRIWRIFRFPMRKMRITNLELMVYWCMLMIPAVLLLITWAIVSTPTAAMKERDGKEHYVCTSGGFTGEPGGLVFFFIFVGYSGIILLVCAFISFVCRNVPSEYRESRLLTISVYNLIFLGCLIIPVFLVVQPINPFVAWILRTCAILYGFTATMFVQFAPVLWGIFITDKGKNVKGFRSNISSNLSKSIPTMDPEV